MPLITPPTGPIAPGGQFPQMLYGPKGIVVLVWTTADVAAAEQVGFGTARDPARDYSRMIEFQEISYPTFNYTSIEKAGLPWSWGDSDSDSDQGNW